MTDTIDEALERMRGASPEHANGVPNHGPMAAEALVTLGCAGEEVVRWVDRYSSRLVPMPERAERITSRNWREALGKTASLADWPAFFDSELAEQSWHSVLGEWLPRLLPGLMAAGTHGFIRTAHAVRSLGAGATPLRLEELAQALGFWAAYYHELPGQPELTGDLAVDKALDQIPRTARPYDARDELPREFVTVLDTVPGFAAAVAALSEPDHIPAALTSLTGTAARLYLANTDQHPLVMLHTVTGPSALRMMLPYMSDQLQRTAFGYIWQAVAGWAAAFSAQPSAGRAVAADRVMTAHEVLERCLEAGDPHAIKFAEACIREHREHADPVYLAAALDWATRMRSAKSWTDTKKIVSGLVIRG